MPLPNCAFGGSNSSFSEEGERAAAASRFGSLMGAGVGGGVGADNVGLRYQHASMPHLALDPIVSALAASSVETSVAVICAPSRRLQLLQTIPIADGARQHCWCFWRHRSQQPLPSPRGVACARLTRPPPVPACCRSCFRRDRGYCMCFKKNLSLSPTG